MIEKDSWQTINDKTTDSREVHDKGIMDKDRFYIYICVYIHISYIIYYISLYMIGR